MTGFLRRLAREEHGLAFIEFAFIGPIMLFLILAGLELVNYAVAHLRVNQIAMTVADNAGRVVTGVDEANVYEVFAGAGVIGDPLDFKANGRVVLSSLQDNGLTGTDAGQMINWQRCWGDLEVAPAYGNEGTGSDDNELAQGMGPAGSRILSAPDTAVMVAEVTYEYRPLISATILPLGVQIRHESAFNVRGRQNNEISNTQDLEILECPPAETGGSGPGGGTSTSGGGTTTTTSGGVTTSSTSTSGGTSGGTTTSSTTSTTTSSGGSNGNSSRGGGNSSGGSNGNSSRGGSNGGNSSSGGSSGGGNNDNPWCRYFPQLPGC